MGLKTITRSLTVALAIGAAILALAACGGDEDDDTASADSGSGSGPSIESIDGTEVLVDADGRALYTSVPEEGGEVLCTGACTSAWDPVSAGSGDSAPEDLGGELGTVSRPDGEDQLTLDGAPLYSFTEEGPGELTGDGFVDDFEGTTFEWHAATPSGASSAEGAAPAAPAEDSAGGY